MGTDSVLANSCGCVLELEASATVLGDVLLEASLGAFLDVCVGARSRLSCSSCFVLRERPPNLRRLKFTDLCTGAKRRICSVCWCRRCARRSRRVCSGRRGVRREQRDQLHVQRANRGLWRRRSPRSRRPSRPTATPPARPRSPWKWASRTRPRPLPPSPSRPRPRRRPHRSRRRHQPK